METFFNAVAADPLETNIHEALSYIRTGDINKPEVYSRICNNLASTINSAIGNNAVPSTVHLPQLVLIAKEVYRRKTEFLRHSLFPFMLTIKVACQVGWFQDLDKDHLLMIAKEATCGLSNTINMNIDPSYADSCISNIISRFYPRMKLEHILTSFDIKAGIGTFAVDFHIRLGTLPRQCQDLWLLVARMDNMDTAACIASPPNVDFLINRNGVPKRTKNDMGKGPQLPSNVTRMIKYGLNLIEAKGDFDGRYMIAVAYMNLRSDPDPPQLQDYIHPASDEDDSDCEVISSRISLNCPISQLRIKTPVKGHLCKHPQCFDYHFFMEINSSRPIWKCPVCKKPVCNLDIRIDQDFLKILNEAANNVSHVIISYDGSWMVDTTKKYEDSMSQNNNVASECIKTGNTDSMRQKNHVASFSVKTEIADSDCLAYSLTVDRSCTLRQSQMTHGSCDVVNTPTLFQYIQPNRVYTTQPCFSFISPNQSQPQQDTDHSTYSLTGQYPSTLRQSPMTHGSCDVVNTPFSVHETKHQPNHVYTTQSQQGQTHRVTRADFDTALYTSANRSTAVHPSTLRQSPVTTCTISPRDFRNPHMQSQGLSDVVHMPPPFQQTSHELDPVNTSQSQPSDNFTNPNRPSAHSQPPQGQTHQTTQPNVGANPNQQQGQTHRATQDNFDTDCSANTQTAQHLSNSTRSPVTTNAVSPQDFMDSHMQSQGLCDIARMPPSLQQTSHQPDPVNTSQSQPSDSLTNPNHPSAQTQPPQDQTNPNHQSSQSQPQQGQINRATLADNYTDGSPNSPTAEHSSTPRQSTVTTYAVSQKFRNSHMQSQGLLSDVVHMPPSFQQTSHQLDPVITKEPSDNLTNPNHSSAQSQPPQGQTHQASQPNLGTCTVNKPQRATQAHFDTDRSANSQTDGVCDVVDTPPSIHETKHQQNPDRNHQLSQSQPQLGQTQRPTQSEFDTAGIKSHETRNTLDNSSSTLHISNRSANRQTAKHPSTSRQSPVTTHAISPRDFRNSHMQSQGLCDVVHMPPSFQQTSHQPNPDPVDTKPPSYSITNLNTTQPSQGQTHQPIQPNHDITITNKPQRKTLYSRVNLKPSSTSSLHSNVVDIEQLRKKVKRTYTLRSQPQAPASGIRPPSPKIQMRGILSGKDLEAARLDALSVSQTIRANEPWSTPRIPLSMALLAQPNTNSKTI